MVPITERVERLAARVDRQVRLRLKPRAERDLAIVLFNFPPNAGATGTAAFLSGCSSPCTDLDYARQGPATTSRSPTPSTTFVPRCSTATPSVTAPTRTWWPRLTSTTTSGEAATARDSGAVGVGAGRLQTDGGSLFVLAALFGRVWSESARVRLRGRSMRLLSSRAPRPPTPSPRFYQYLREDFGADAVLHLVPTARSSSCRASRCACRRQCWPDRLIVRPAEPVSLDGAQQSSEGTLARRRGAATLISCHLTPPIRRSGLYESSRHCARRGPAHRARPQFAERGPERLVPLILEQAEALDLWPATSMRSRTQLLELERTLDPTGLHVVR